MSVHYQQLEKRFEEIGHFENILNILHWDIACNMKEGSEKSRVQEILSLTRVIRQSLTSDETKEWLNQAEQEKNSLDVWQKANLREIKAKIQDEEIVDQELQNNFILATTQAELAWRKARQQNDYEMFKPYFQKVLDYVKQIAHLRSKALNIPLYDALVVRYEPGNTVENIKQVFAVLKEELPPLIKKVMQKQSQNGAPLQLSMSIEKQKELNNKMMEKAGFNVNKGRLDESAHPFCGGTADDVRLTTRYDQNNFLDGFMGTMHEVGHALYEQNLPEKYKNQPVGKPRGYQFHESQSLLIEKQVVKTKEFLTYLADFLKNDMQMKDPLLTVDNLYQEVSRVQPSFIRIYSDEVTYPLHIILRFELEEMLVNDQLTLDELPHVWNQKMKDYFGIVPNNVSEGCLQDVHWPSGYFGYFPSYLNGTMISSMLMSKIKKNNSEIKKDFTKGDFTNVNQYLNQNFRNFGSLYPADELLKISTGENQIDPHAFVKYLEEKYLSN
ncbi:carboxypeptidase M32 [Candidatus Phytoplasma pruni]|uniref:Metal-dependent carboxypeptidase n=1 Tax=Candidatus Phytoplasma pruni TaxID=479893 RepID=A0A851HD94_9MOLU|nr:carboxypeptidase M32 [Candidatus Phytoplasma pruni]NWN46061.1 carboxypeptidase M32 [Candidatus Phytoplasma pruni]